MNLAFVVVEVFWVVLNPVFCRGTLEMVPQAQQDFIMGSQWWDCASDIASRLSLHSSEHAHPCVHANAHKWSFFLKVFPLPN